MLGVETEQEYFLFYLLKNYYYKNIMRKYKEINFTRIHIIKPISEQNSASEQNFD